MRITRKLVGTLLSKMCVSSSGARCHLQVKSYKYCLWDCIESQLVGKRLFRIIANYFPPSVFIQGTMVWTSLVCSTFHYDAESMDHGFHTNFGSLCSF